jgi:acyl-CoA reductase-like NAD-dependent aldehyde dehydrogenase
VNTATEKVIAQVPKGDAEDVNRAVLAARKGFDAWSRTDSIKRIAILKDMHARLTARKDELARTLSEEMGGPLWHTAMAQLGMPLANFQGMIDAAEQLHLEEKLGSSIIAREPIGVVGAITPWNFPLHQIVAKVVAALAAGCTIVLKPSEVAPLTAYVFAEIAAEAGLPPGVLNLVCGDGALGAAIASHPDVDMVSFTGSTGVGKRVAALGAATVKKVALELGGKSANIILPDADLLQAIPTALRQCFGNSGQSCVSMSRLLVPSTRKKEIEELCVAAAATWIVGDPFAETTRLGPVANKAQYERVRGFIQRGIAEGARLLCGGPDRPSDIAHGYYIQPTVFTDVKPEMAIAQEEIFGPVLSIIAFDTEDDAVAIANDVAYGLSGGVWSGDKDRAVRIARRMRTGQVIINGAALNFAAPFGGYKQSGLGRENGRFGIEEFFELKNIQGAY